jgi:hypothetical protein
MRSTPRVSGAVGASLCFIAAFVLASLFAQHDAVASGGNPGSVAAWVLRADGSIDALGVPFLGSPTRTDGVALAADIGAGVYWVAFPDATVQGFGAVPDVVDLSALDLVAPVVGASSVDGKLWLVTADGGVFDLVGGSFFGSIGGRPLDEPVVGMAITPSQLGYWLVAADGGVFAFGDAGFYGSVPGLGLGQINGAIVGIVPTATGGGYWLVAADGGVFAFGDARFLGSFAGVELGSGDRWLGAFAGPVDSLVLYAQSGNLGGLGADFATPPVGELRDMDGAFLPSA